MITFSSGNLLDADVEAVVNTVNTVGVMGKGIALMFKEAFPDNYTAYQAACKRGEVTVGRMFITERRSLVAGPKWIINFPTKDHWRNPSKLTWIIEGLDDLKGAIQRHNIGSIAIPPLGSGNGGLDWNEVRPRIVAALGDMDVRVVVYEPTSTYQNVAKREGVEKLTPARALVAELVRQYMVLGIECTLLEVQKLVYFLQKNIKATGGDNPFKLEFNANKFGPYATNLTHLLNQLDGSYLHCDKRLADAGPMDVIRFEYAKRDWVSTYLATEAKAYGAALEATLRQIDGFESPLGMELMATVDWMLEHQGVEPTAAAVRMALKKWPGGEGAGRRKLKLFDERLIDLAIERLTGEEAMADAHRT